jgi:hypothetical protein
MLHQLGQEWEHNGRDDSDWYAIAYDDATDSLRKVETGTTRFADALHHTVLEKATPEVETKAELALRRIVRAALAAADEDERLRPGRFTRGLRVVLTREAKNRDKANGGWIRFVAGSAGEVAAEAHFGTFYRNGYNRPGRENARVLVRFDDGRSGWVAGASLILERVALTEAELDAKSEQLASYRNWPAAFGVL